MERLPQSLMTLEQFAPKPEPKTIVVFRKENETGEILAVFVEENYYHYDSSSKTCYAHIGQHSACNLDYVAIETVEATPEEYKDLADELTNSIGYNLDIQQDYQYTE